jgi:hypothetical protein
VSQFAHVLANVATKSWLSSGLAKYQGELPSTEDPKDPFAAADLLGEFQELIAIDAQSDAGTEQQRSANQLADVHSDFWTVGNLATISY